MNSRQPNLKMKMSKAKTVNKKHFFNCFSQRSSSFVLEEDSSSSLAFLVTQRWSVCKTGFALGPPSFRGSLSGWWPWPHPWPKGGNSNVGRGLLRGWRGKNHCFTVLLKMVSTCRLLELPCGITQPSTHNFDGTVQRSCSGWPTGYGKKLSRSQAQLGQVTCLAFA